MFSKTNNKEEAVETGAVAPRRSRRLLAPLATLAVAGAVAIGSGAQFTSSSNNSASNLAAGTVSHSNSKANAAVYNVNNLKPGDTVNGDVTITNTGSLAQVFSLTETATNNFVTKADLQLTVTQAGNTVWTGTYGTMGTISLGQFAVGEARTYRFSAQLKSTADNSEQGKTATGTYVWDGTQTTAVTVTQAADQAATATNANP